MMMMPTSIRPIVLRNVASANAANHLRKQRTVKVSWLKWRWLLLAPFILGYLFTYSILREGETYLVLTLVAIASCMILLTRLNRSIDVTLPFWTILAVFLIGYYVKYYLLVLYPDLFLETGQMTGSSYSSSALLPAFKLATIAFTCFCLSGWVFLGFARKRYLHDAVEADGAVYRSVARFLIWTVPFLMLLTYIIAYRTGIAIMGLASVSLPFRMAGVIFYIRTVLIPTLIIVLVLCGNKGEKSSYRRTGIFLLVLHGLSDVLLRSSRGQFIVLILALGFLFLLKGQGLKRSETAVLLAGFLLTIILAPFITEYRNYRIISQDKNIVSALIWSGQGGVGEKAGIGKTFASGLSFVLARLTGIDMLLRYTSLGVTPLGINAIDVIRSPRGIAGYVTIDLLGIPEQANTSSAVSLPGWFYLVGGTGFMAVGMIAFVAFVWAIWAHFRRLQLRILPAAQAIFLLWVYSIAVEGTLDTQGIMFIATLASIMLCEWLVRRFEKTAWKRHTHRFSN
jgi:hypothetical protein